MAVLARAVLARAVLARAVLAGAVVPRAVVPRTLWPRSVLLRAGFPRVVPRPAKRARAGSRTGPRWAAANWPPPGGGRFRPALASRAAAVSRPRPWLSPAVRAAARTLAARPRPARNPPPERAAPMGTGARAGGGPWTCRRSRPHPTSRARQRSPPPASGRRGPPRR